jgi:hypothetical protein
LSPDAASINLRAVRIARFLVKFTHNSKDALMDIQRAEREHSRPAALD